MPSQGDAVIYLMDHANRSRVRAGGGWTPTGPDGQAGTTTNGVYIPGLLAST